MSQTEVNTKIYVPGNSGVGSPYLSTIWSQWVSHHTDISLRILSSLHSWEPAADLQNLSKWPVVHSDIMWLQGVMAVSVPSPAALPHLKFQIMLVPRFHKISGGTLKIGHQTSS